MRWKLTPRGRFNDKYIINRLMQEAPEANDFERQEVIIINKTHAPKAPLGSASTGNA